MAAQEQSVISSASYSATDLSKRTDRTHYTIPDDGREITLHPESKRRRRRTGGAENHSVLSTGTNASLLIEYFEQGKTAGGSSERRPSVKVKITPAAAKKMRQKDGSSGINFSEAGTDRSQQPSHVQRISLSPHTGDDRMTFGEGVGRGRARSYSGDQSTLSSNITADDSNVSPRPLNVTVIREAGSPGSFMSSPRDIDDPAFRRQRRRGTSRTNTGDTTFYEDDNLKVSRQRRSRSVSGETDHDASEKFKLARRRSRSVERGGMTTKEKEMIEQGVREELARMRNPKKKTTSRQNTYDDDEGLKPSHARNRSRAPMDELSAQNIRARKKAAQIEGGYAPRSRSGSSTINNPALINLIKDTINQMVLPEINEIKATQKRNISQEIALSRANSRRPGPSSSLPDIAPSVVLSPDLDRGKGQGVVISGGRRDKDQTTAESEVSDRRAPGFGTGPGPQSPQLSEPEGEGVSLVNTDMERLDMPAMPFRNNSPGHSAVTRASIQTARSGVPPYPATTQFGGMPSSGTTPPPAPLNNNKTHTSDAEPGFIQSIKSFSSSHAPSPAQSAKSAAALAKLSATRTNSARDANSIASFKDDHDDRMSTASSKKPPANIHSSGYSDLSIEGMSSVFPKDRRSNKAAEDLSDVDFFYAEQREKQQEQALMNPGRFQDTSLEVRHMSTEPDNELDAMHYRDVDVAQNVYALGANPSMRSTPVNAMSAHASVINASNVDGFSSLSFRNSRPHMSASAIPTAGSPMPELAYLAAQELGDDLQTNPSEIQGPISGHPAEWQMNSRHDTPLDDDYSQTRALSPGDMLLAEAASARQAGSRLTTPGAKDEGYMSAGNPLSPGNMTPLSQMHKDGLGMGGLDEMLSEADFYGINSRRIASGESHGMPSPLYDSSNGHGIERIQSKDIIALMEHLTVRDAQRNARDTEILVTLVRSAAEMRNSFEDMKKQLEDSQRNIITEVDNNTERSVQKLIQGPRPLPPPAPRKPRYQKSDEDAEEIRKKRQSIFKRALKGLSGRSPKELERIEDMLEQLLDEVEGLRDDQQFYQQHFQSASVHTMENDRRSFEEHDEPATEVQTAQTARHVTVKAPTDVPTGMGAIQEDDVLDTPRENRRESLPLESPPQTKFSGASLGNTPTKAEKSSKRESGTSSIFPRISRWSETTASSGFKNIFSSKGKGKEDGSEASRSQQDFNFWETEAAKGNAADQFRDDASYGAQTPRAGSPNLVPPTSRGSDAPINQASRVSLDIIHPQPRMVHNHALETQAQHMIANGGLMDPSSPNNNSMSSLGTFPPIGPGGFQNGQLLSPLAKDAYLQHQLQTTPKAVQKPTNTAAPAITFDDIDAEGIHSPTGGESPKSRREKKHRSERDVEGHKVKRERTDEEKQRRREKKERRDRERAEGIESPSRRRRSKDLLSQDGDGPSISGRTPSTASRLTGPRPLSNASNKEGKKYRNRDSQNTDDTFGNNNGGRAAASQYADYANYR